MLLICVFSSMVFEFNFKKWFCEMLSKCRRDLAENADF